MTENPEPCPIVLVCQHLMIREGFEKFCLDDGEYTIFKTFHSIDQIGKDDFNPQVGLILICQECNREQLGQSEQSLLRFSLFFPNAQSVIINSESSQEEMTRFIRLGIRGFFPKKFSPENMKKAFQAVLNGETWVSRRLTDGLLTQLIRETTNLNLPDTKNRFDLSGREIEVIRALAAGLSNHQIGEKLFISEKTVKAHIHHIFKKMDAKNRIQAVIKARESNLI